METYLKEDYKEGVRMLEGIYQEEGSIVFSSVAKEHTKDSESRSMDFRGEVILFRSD